MTSLATHGLLERDDDLAAIGRGLEGSREGAGALVVVEGPAGIGKSRLLEAAAAEAASRVLAARGHELEEAFPYGVVRQLFEPFVAQASGADRERWFSGAAALARPLLDPRAEGGPDPAAASPVAVLHALYWLCATLAEDEPLVLQIDDAHWADDESLAFAGYLARRLAELPIAVVVATRPGHEARAPLAALLDEPSALTVRPAALSREAVARYVGAGVGVGERFVDACQETTGGNPFLLHELLQELRAEGGEPVDAQADRVRSIGPRAVARSVLRRLGRLAPEATGLAQAIAVLGDDVDVAHAAALAGLAPGAAARLAAALQRADVLAGDLRALTFVHPIVRAAVYEELPATERGLRHARAATVLQDAGAPTGRIAAHLRLAPPTGDPGAVATLRAAAATALEQGASRTAVDLLRRALDEDPPDDQRAPLLLELGSAEALVDGPAAVRRLREAIAITPDARTRAQLGYGLARALLFAGTSDEVVEACDAARAELGDGPEDAGLRRMIDAMLLNQAVIVPELRPTANAMVDALRADPPPEDLGGRMLQALVAVDEARRLLPDADAAERARRALADGVLATHDVGGGPLMLGCLAVAMADRFDEAWHLLEQALDEAHRQGSTLGHVATRIFRAQTLLWRGELADAVAEAGDALEGTRSHGIHVGNPMFSGLWADALCEQGDIEGAARAIAAAGAPPGLPPHFAFIWFGLARARVRAARGEHAGALDDTLVAGALYTSLDGRNPALFPWRSQAAQLHALLGDHDAAQALAAEEVELARTSGVPRAIGRALRIAGLSARREPDLDQLREAAAVLTDSPARLEQAYAFADLGTGLRRRGQRVAARDALARALDLASICGAEPLAERAREELVAAGARPRRVVLSGVGALTGRERQVAELASEGCSNREIAQRLFVTEKTVEAHLGRAYTKLGVRSRTQLPAALAA